jgi:short-subunit dehydrogenase
MKVNGSIVLITGASSGIGAATAKAMARTGGRVVLLARTQAALEQVAADISASGGEAKAYPIDLTDAEAVAKVAKTITAQIGTPDILINNAGAGRWLFVEETSPAEAMEMMAVPYFAAFYVTRAFLPDMLRRGSGHIVNITSPASRIVWPGATAYTAARWAMRGFTEALRSDLRSSGLRVTLAVLGKVRSAYWEHNLGSEERLPKIAKLIPTLTPEQAATAIVGGVQRDAREIVTPFMLRLIYMQHAIFPRLVEWMMSSTGWKRSQNVKGRGLP